MVSLEEWRVNHHSRVGRGTRAVYASSKESFGSG